MQPTTVEVTDVDRINLSEIPVSVLRQATFKLLAVLLNKKKIFKSEDGYYRDWRGLFQAIPLENHYIAEVEADADPCKKIFELWKIKATKEGKAPSLLELQNILGIIDRWDVVDDSNKLFREDAEQYLAEKQRVHLPISANQLIETEQLSNNQQVADDDIITKDDTIYKKQIYDAFVLFADADIEFASKIVHKMEERNLKLCLKDRDVLAGISFEHNVLVKLISERCNRLIVVFSKEFLKSPLNEFVVTYAQAMQIEQKLRKILPCVYERIELPPALKYTTILDYKRSEHLFNYWDKLESSIKVRKDPPKPAEVKTPSAPAMPVPEIKVDPIDEPVAPKRKPQPQTQPQSTTTTVALTPPSEPTLKTKSVSLRDISATMNRLLNSKSAETSASTSELCVKPEKKERKLLDRLKIGRLMPKKSGESKSKKKKLAEAS
ncbi:myeloid differentiation primary response protein MyD88 [Culex pipiens pallens]|uniref:myeloid differentiation primary response protein MyD88 n=1 Tax=Culex pipiens pallens TaxID=42434 RepID=UPI001953051A|nr:myeloid differentiation primary response protein MyD88 [Culex pipiens pallens]